MRHQSYLTYLAGALFLVACNINSFPLEGKTGEGIDGGPDQRDDGATNDAQVNPEIDAATCVVSGLDNQCDEIDNDCDGMVDEEINKDLDSANCGMCGNECTAFGAVMACQSGSCELTGCQPGFKNLDTATDDCEYACPVFPEAVEDCNGIDDDCDGLIDLADPDIAPPPTGQCRTTAGTPCAGTSMVCETRNGLARWYCDYSASVEFDPSIPNGIMQQEVLCDGFDGDCDGVADDAFNLGADCNNGLLGICFDQGSIACDAADNTATTCNLQGLGLPAVSEADITECNAIDEDCDGSIDEGDHSAWVSIGGGVEMMAYEASRPDADGASAGVVESNGACSKPGVMPWTEVQYGEAANYCAAIGARLCSESEWESSCSPVTEAITNVVVEAETGTASTGSGARRWEVTADVAASGGSYMRALPDDQDVEFFTPAQTAADSQRLDFAVTLPNAGDWTVWVRARRGDGGGCQDYIWFGSDGTPEVLFKQFRSETWQWYSTDFLSYRVTTNAAAANTALNFNVWMACNDVRIDKIAFVQDVQYIPSLASDPATTINQSCRYAYDPATYSCLDYVPGVCNDSAYANPDDVYATGTEEGCFADLGGGDSAFDMTGNVKEWTQTRGSSINPIRGGGYNSGAAGLSCQFATTADDDFKFSNLGFRCCR